MLTAKDIMTRKVITVRPETEIAQAAEILLTNRINGVPVINKEGDLVGILCQSDLIAQQKNIPIPSLFTLLDGYIPLTLSKRLDKEVEKIAATKAAEAMTPDPVTVSPETSIENVAALMVEKNYHTLPVVDADKLVDECRRVMNVAQMREVDRLEQRLATLATIGSTSPYVGLFGTVWGIMTAFMKLGGMQTATLAVVAPPIAEALIATAMGLFAAIPAVIAYNKFANTAESLNNRYEVFMEEFLSIVNRQDLGDNR